MTVDLRHINMKEVNLRDNYYYKLSSSGIYGYEAVYEYVASRVGRQLGLNVALVDLIEAIVSIDGSDHTTLVSRAENYMQQGDTRLAYTAIRSPYILDSLLMFDFLIVNRNRSESNIEIIQGRDLRVAPFFSNGQSFGVTDPFQDIRVINCLGGDSLFQNLLLIKNPVHISNMDLSFLRELRSLVPDDLVNNIANVLVARMLYLQDKGYCVTSVYVKPKKQGSIRR